MSTAARTLGFANLKPEQHRAVVELVRGRDTFVSLPTGYGKSLIYRNLTYFVQLLSESGELERLRDPSPLLVRHLDGSADAACCWEVTGV